MVGYGEEKEREGRWGGKQKKWRERRREKKRERDFSKYRFCVHKIVCVHFYY